MTAVSGDTRRTEGVSAVTAADAAVNRDYGRWYRLAVDELLLSGEMFDVDDITERAALLAPPGAVPHSPALIGGTLSLLLQHGVIAVDGLTKSHRPTRQGSRNYRFCPGPNARRRLSIVAAVLAADEDASVAAVAAAAECSWSRAAGVRRDYRGRRTA